MSRSIVHQQKVSAARIHNDREAADLSLHMQGYAYEVRDRALQLLLAAVREKTIQNIRAGKAESNYPVSDDRRRKNPTYVANRSEKSIFITVGNGEGSIGYTSKAFYAAIRERSGPIVFSGRMRFPNRHTVNRRGRHPIVKADIVVQIPRRPMTRAFEECLGDFGSYLEQAVREVSSQYEAASSGPRRFFKITQGGRKVYTGGNISLQVRLRNG